MLPFQKYQTEYSVNSTQTSISSESSTSFSRSSFDTSDAPNSIPKPHRSSESSWQAIRTLALQKTSLSFNDFNIVRDIVTGDIGKVPTPVTKRQRNGQVKQIQLLLHSPENSIPESSLQAIRTLALQKTSLSYIAKPHRSSESSWQAIKTLTLQKTSLSFNDFIIVREIGSGDIGKVYLCRLRNEDETDRLNKYKYNFCYAMKVVDTEALAVKKKTERLETEKKILNMLDHPFLPSLYAQFEASHFSCVVMEYCSGGDLHSLRYKQPDKRFSISAARFYAAEVLVALEYLHMLGIIYRDLKPENVLVRSDGHFMLTDFDLSLCSDAIAAVQFPSVSSSPSSPEQLTSRPRSNPFSCLPTQLFRSKRIQTISAAKQLFVAEPVSARSCSFVGTHEYVAPEVASGRSHGNAVDWWALGIFIYEMIYGCTPFAGASNEATLRSIIKNPLKFPKFLTVPISSRETQARDLISKLLDKDPERRFGSKRGAADIKTHPFFNGLNFALIRSARPPVIPRQTTTLAQCADGLTSSSFDVF